MAKNVVTFTLSFMILTKMWIFELSLWVGSMERHDLVHSLGYLVSNGRQILLRGYQIRWFCHFPHGFGSYLARRALPSPVLSLPSFPFPPSHRGSSNLAGKPYPMSAWTPMQVDVQALVLPLSKSLF